MRKHPVAFVDGERDQSTDSGNAVPRVEEEPLMFQGAPPRFDHGVRELQFGEGQDPAQQSRVTRSSTWAFTFSTPASANTTGVVSEGVVPRLASSSTATVFTGANISATRHAKIRREKLSITACRYVRVPSRRRMTVVSMCHISSARVVRRPTFVFAGCTRSRGRRQPNFRTRWYQVE